MEQLEKRFYTLDELAEITGMNCKANNFKRNVENALTKWGYSYDWFNRRGATITGIPTSPEERLQELLVRQFHVDIQVDMYAFSCFVTAFTDIDGFDSMPWEEREKVFQEYLGRKVDKRTLSKWSKTLIEQEIMGKDCVGSYWKTEIIDKRKIRSPATEKEYEEYEIRRRELMRRLEEFAMDAMRQDPQLPYKEAVKIAWKELYSILWDEFNCCYYCCKTFQFTMWNDQGDLVEVYELIREISEKHDAERHN